MTDDETELLRFRSTLRHFPSGVAVVTVAHGTDVHGMTASSFTSVSLDPRLCSVSVNKPGRMHKLLRQTDGRYGISVLHADQGSIADFFARRPWSTGSGAAMAWREGCPVLAGALVWLVCEKWAEYEGGDHTIFVGRVLGHGATANPNPSPLVHHNSSYHRLGLPMAATDRSAGEA
ncbi:flavin reductase family protein [Amycolatopsis sp. FDAARGOS 1241]|uniref:flavin reductase family protein n=1 Tax=Amycolatopsis sp. FDAARGOS 1241 TaxID=2778070 RepID=UPI00195030BB|nr:flavin reductase family protein [Amycolatopsis sp. FDAARGOS 1241]QRP48552.1 flavin reductase [Amycolatopsis sp. FDAARGOS 1241]